MYKMEKHNTFSISKIKPRCIVCNRNLKAFERNLCSCMAHVCMKHRNKFDHGCSNGIKYTVQDKIIPNKVNQI